MKILTNLDLLQSQLLNVVVQKLATPPTNPIAGQIYFNTQSNRLFVYNGSEWIGADAIEATMTGEDIVDAINNQGEKISILNIDIGVFSSTKDGLVPKGSGSTAYLRADGTWQTPPDTKTTIVDNLTSTSASSALSARQGKTLKDELGDRIKTDVPANAKFTDTTYDRVTSSADSLMSKEDKEKIDGIEVGANKTTVVDNLTSTSSTSVLSARQGKTLKDLVDTKETPSGRRQKPLRPKMQRSYMPTIRLV